MPLLVDFQVAPGGESTATYIALEGLLARVRPEMYLKSTVTTQVFTAEAALVPRRRVGILAFLGPADNDNVTGVQQKYPTTSGKPKLFQLDCFVFTLKTFVRAHSLCDSIAIVNLDKKNYSASIISSSRQ